MSSPIVAVDINSDIEETTRTMVSRSVGAVLVSDGKQYQGIITKKDIVVMVSEGHNPREVKAKEIMSFPLERIEASSNVIDVARKIAKKRFRRLVVFEGQLPIGVISDRDIVRVAPDIIDILIEYAKMGGK